MKTQCFPFIFTQHSKLQDLTVMLLFCHVNCLRQLLSLQHRNRRECKCQPQKVASRLMKLVPHNVTLSCNTPDPLSAFFFHSCLQCESFAPLFSSGYLTLSSVCSSCCDQRASRFHWRFICQPAQQGMRCGKGERWCTCTRDSATPQKVSHSMVQARVETVVLTTGSMSCKVTRIIVWFHAGGPCRVQNKGRDALWTEANASLFTPLLCELPELIGKKNLKRSTWRDAMWPFKNQLPLCFHSLSSASKDKGFEAPPCFPLFVFHSCTHIFYSQQVQGTVWTTSIGQPAVSNTAG